MTVKLNPEFKEKLVKALRSGRYKQGRNVLRGRVEPTDPISYCCVGVGCNILNPKGWYEGGQSNGSQVTFGWKDKATVETRTLAPLWPFVGEPEDLKTTGYWSDGARTAGATLSHLASLNDDGKSFPAIADWIEENL